MKRFWPILKSIFVAWGFISFIGAAAIGAYVAYQAGPGNTDAINSANKQDVRFVLNWCRLGDERIEAVIHSYQSARSFSGDHLDAYAIKISHIDPAELKKDEYGSGWFRCDQAEGVLKDSIDYLGGWLDDENISWFPRLDEIKSEEFYVYPWSIYFHGIRPTAVELVFLRPKDKMLYYISTKE